VSITFGVGVSIFYPTIQVVTVYWSVDTFSVNAGINGAGVSVIAGLAIDQLRIPVCLGGDTFAVHTLIVEIYPVLIGADLGAITGRVRVTVFIPAVQVVTICPGLVVR
jgi:hypothetical protein